MSYSRFWNRVSKVTESRPAKVLRDLTGTVKAGCLFVGVLWIVVSFVFPFLCDVASFVFHNAGWLLLTGLSFIVVAVVLAGITGGAGECYSYEYQGQILRPCHGGIVTTPFSGSDCIRIDPFENCFRTEPCIGLSYGRGEYVDPFPKLPPCSDILDESGLINAAYRNLDCVQVDSFDPCYRPVTC